MYVDILFPLTKAIPIMFERVTTHCQTLHTYMLPRVTIKFIKRYMLISFLKKLTVARGNTFQRAQSQQISVKMYGNACDNACGNAFKLW